MSFRVVSRIAASRLVAASTRRTFAQYVPALGTDEEMKQQAIEQIRARVKYQKELMSHPDKHHDDAGEMWRWLNIFFWVAIPVTTLSCLYSFFFDEHSHRIPGPEPVYHKIRAKEYPWECGDCDLFDLDCWKKCRAEKAGK